MAATLLLIDIQNGLDNWDYYGGDRNNTDAEKNMSTILSYWRSNNWTLYHIKHNSTESHSPLRPDQEGNDIKNEVKPLPEEVIIDKTANSAFIGTDLHEQLQKQNVKELVVIGLTTEHCVSTTVRMAANYGYSVKLISDATAAFGKRGINGENIEAERVHNTELAILNNEFCKVLSTDQLISEMNESKYWSDRYKDQNTGWDIGYPSTPLKEYINQLTDKSIKILIPGAGNAYEAEYLLSQGFTNVHILDVSPIPLRTFQKRVPDFPKDQLIEGDFFSHDDQYDLILEQTFFCSFPPTQSNRSKYAKKMASLLKPKGKLVGVWFDVPLPKEEERKRPFGGTKEEYLEYLSPYFEVITFDRCYNSIPPRMGNELFGILQKK